MIDARSIQNDIALVCPALTDGLLGDMIYFHSLRSPGLVIDIVQDIRQLNNLALGARKAGMIILGGGVCKHQIANAMLMVGGILLRFRSFLIFWAAQWSGLCGLYCESCTVID